jgi:hypothetical protein
LHCIAAGMNWSPTDLTIIEYSNFTNKEKLKLEWDPFIKRLDERKKTWEKSIKNELSLYKFLKKYIYK